MLKWPVWARFLAINAALPWAIVLVLRVAGLYGRVALLAVLSASVILLALNIWHIRASAEWRAAFVALAVLNPLCTFFFSNVALATSFGSLQLLFRMLLANA